MFFAMPCLSENLSMSTAALEPKIALSILFFSSVGRNTTYGCNFTFNGSPLYS